RRLLVLATLGAAPVPGTGMNNALLSGLDSQMLFVRVPTYAIDANHRPLNCRSRATLNEWTLVATRSLVRARNGPFSENGAFWSKVTGKMLVCPPGLPRNGLSRPPGGLFKRISEPHGGATDVLRWNCAFTNSYALPYAARTEVLPEPVGSHATPTRGPKLFQSVSIPACDGKPASPGNVRPAGPFGKTVLFVPARKRSMSN